MFFSILVPIYNTSEYLKECLESIIHQTFQDFELVLMDDGSTDTSPQICDEYADKYPLIRVIHKENEGLMMTRRRGFQEALGQYFICVDSDDKLYDLQALEKIHDTIRSTGCDLVLYNYMYGAGGGREEHPRILFDYPSGHVFEGKDLVELYDKLLTTNNMNNMWIKCPSRNIVDIDVDYTKWKKYICRAEDLFQSYPMLSKAKKVAYIKDPLYYYRWAPDSISNKPKFKYCDSFKCIFKREDKYLKKWPLSAETREIAIRRRLTRYMDVLSKCYYTCKKNGNVNEWKDFIKKLSKDRTFMTITKGCDKKKILKYYRLLYFLMQRRMCNTAILVMETTSFILKMKRGRN